MEGCLTSIFAFVYEADLGDGGVARDKPRSNKVSQKTFPNADCGAAGHLGLCHTLLAQGIIYPIIVAVTLNDRLLQT